VVVGGLPAGWIFTHDDSGGGSTFFAVDPEGQTAVRYGLVFGPRRSLDWEDMAAATAADGTPVLLLGDIGDNSRTRPFITVYEVAEPDPTSGGPTAVDVPVRATRHYVYEDGPRDAEAMAVDPATGRIVVISKEVSGRSGVYLADGAVIEPGGGLPSVSLLRRVATIDFTGIASPYDPSHYSPASRLLATGTDASPDGSRLVVRTYIEAFEWELGPAGIAGLAGEPHRIDLPPTDQGEAIGYAWDGRSVVVTSEGVHAPVHFIAA
jgi:hypothetical protein